MRTAPYSAVSIARQYIGVREIPGAPHHNPLIVAMLKSAAAWTDGDETAWCGAFVHWICFQLDLPSSALPLRARTYLTVGTPIPHFHAEPGFDIAIFKRGAGRQPGPEVLTAPGHVAFINEPITGEFVSVIGGNQGDAVSIACYPLIDLLGIRRLR